MIKENVNKLVPNKLWFSLHEVCNLKSINYRSACNYKERLQPNKGIPDARICGKKMWNRETVLDWLVKSDDELKENSLEETSCKI